MAVLVSCIIYWTGMLSSVTINGSVLYLFLWNLNALKGVRLLPLPPPPWAHPCLLWTNFHYYWQAYTTWNLHRANVIEYRVGPLNTVCVTALPCKIIDREFIHVSYYWYIVIVKMYVWRKLRKLVDSRQSYCNNKKVTFLLDHSVYAWERQSTQ